MKLCLLVNRQGEVVDWLGALADTHDTRFHPPIQMFQDRMVILADTAYHACDGDPPNLKLCSRSTWNGRMLLEIVFAMLTLISRFAKIVHRVADHVLIRLAFTVAAFNLLIQWNDLKLDKHGFMPLSIGGFNL